MVIDSRKYILFAISRNHASLVRDYHGSYGDALQHVSVVMVRRLVAHGVPDYCKFSTFIWNACRWEACRILDKWVRRQNGFLKHKKRPRVVIHDFDAGLEREEADAFWDDAMRNFTARQRLIFTLRNGLFWNEPQSLSEVGNHLKVTRERVRQIENRCLSRIQWTLRQKEINDLVTHTDDDQDRARRAVATDSARTDYARGQPWMPKR